MKENLIDHAKTIGIIIAIVAGITLLGFLITTYAEYLVAFVVLAVVVYLIYSIYTGILKDVKTTRKRKEIANARKNQE